MNFVKKLCRTHKVVCLQETHGVKEDLFTLESEITSHFAFGSFCASAGAGGTIILLHKSLSDSALLVGSSTIQKGRALEVTISYSVASLQFIVVHVDPAANHGDKVALYRSIKEASLGKNEGGCFLAGDFNHQIVGEARMNLVEGCESFHHEPLAVAFDNIFVDLVELQQPACTRAQLLGNDVLGASRIDRIYCNMFPIDVLDSHSKITTIGDIYSNNVSVTMLQSLSLCLHPHPLHLRPLPFPSGSSSTRCLRPSPTRTCTSWR